MSMIRTILFRSIVEPFYRQNAGFFIFLFIILFGAVGVVDGAGLIAFHLSLIQGLLKNPSQLLLVILLWLLYAKKCEQFILNVLRRPDFSFLNMLSLLRVKDIYWLMATVQFLLYLPVLIYAALIFVLGIYLHTYAANMIILASMITICLLSARWYLYQIQNPGISYTVNHRLLAFGSAETLYWILFIRYILKKKKLLFAAIKLFSCGILYGMLVNQTGTRSELNMIILFFSLGILGHGLLIHQLRELEETRLTYYRAIPFSLFKRFIQYGFLYFVLLLPEIITIASLTPKYLHYREAMLLVFFSYSILLFLNSLLFIQFFRMNDYLKIILCIFLFIYLSLLTVSFPLFCIIIFLSSLAIFFGRYYQYERRILS